MGKKYKVIVIDAPWLYKDKASAGKRGASHKYNEMTLSDIQSLPIKDIADDDCALFMWGTWPLLQECLNTIKAYGFTYKTIAFNWIKMNKKATNTLFWSMGNFTRSNSEYCLMAVRGKPVRISKSVHSVIMSPIQKHSKKPDEARKRIEELFGDVSRVDIFARELHEGWTCLGNEIDGRDITDALDELINFDD